jgi:hypothetical protein
VADRAGAGDLIGDHDATRWAERFASVFEVRRLADIGNRGIVEPLDTEDLMLTWFACAIETGAMPLPRPEPVSYYDLGESGVRRG